MSKTADLGTITKAYRRLARQKHPDKGGDPEEFKALAEAYEVLTSDTYHNGVPCAFFQLSRQFIEQARGYPPGYFQSRRLPSSRPYSQERFSTERS